MRTKKVLAILIAIAFATSAILCFAILFSVKKIDVKFNVSTGLDVSEISEKLDEYDGSNLLFLDIQEVEEELKQFPYFEVNCIKKNYPNVLSIEITERREVYEMVVGDKVVFASSDGLVLKQIELSTWQGESREKILLQTEGIEFDKIEVGNYLSCSDNELLYSVFDMALTAQLTDCIKTLKVISEPFLRKDAEFTTYTGCKILITEADLRSNEKITKAFNAYYDKANDYQKTFGKIEVRVLTETNKISVLWSPREE